MLIRRRLSSRFLSHAVVKYSDVSKERTVEVISNFILPNSIALKMEAVFYFLTLEILNTMRWKHPKEDHHHADLHTHWMLFYLLWNKNRKMSTNVIRNTQFRILKKILPQSSECFLRRQTDERMDPLCRKTNANKGKMKRIFCRNDGTYPENQVWYFPKQCFWNFLVLQTPSTVSLIKWNSSLKLLKLADPLRTN